MPFFFKIAFAIKNNTFIFNSKDPIIKASILLKENKYYECFMILFK